MHLTKREVELLMIDRGIPDHMHQGVMNYLFHGIISPSGFLHSVFSNNFLEAVIGADVDNGLRIRDWAIFLRDLPNDCYGSREKVETYCGRVQGNVYKQSGFNHEPPQQKWKFLTVDDSTERTIVWSDEPHPKNFDSTRIEYLLDGAEHGVNWVAVRLHGIHVPPVGLYPITPELRACIQIVP